MSRFYQKFLSTVFFTIYFSDYSFSLDNKSVEKVAVVKEFPGLDFKRMEQKCLQYQKLANRSKNFRKAVYVSSAVAAAGLLTYFGFKFFWKSGKKEENSSAVLEKEKLEKLLNSFDALNSQKKEPYKLDFGNIFKLGISNGFYWGLSGAVVAPFLWAQTGLLNVLKNKFVTLWNGQSEENFLSTVKLLEVNTKQLGLFFQTWDLLDDEDELKENYALFIDCIENLIALATQSTVDLLSSKPAMQQSIIKLRDILCAKILDFSEELQQFLSLDLTEEQNSTKLDFIKISFKKLSDQIGRFVNLYYSALYEA
jgi:hypothetical protein